MAVTMQDIAEHTGLSRPTVSLALSHKGTIADKTRQRVLAAARELGYRPNSYARAVRRGRFGNVALLLSTDRGRSYLGAYLLAGIHEALADRELHLTVTMLPDASLTDEFVVPRILRELSADGMLINYTDQIPPRMLKLIADYDLPAVWINTQREADCVYPDDAGLAANATRKLLELGHRRIAYADFTVSYRELPEKHYSRRDREAGYARAMTEAGLVPRVLRGTEEPIGQTGQRAASAQMLGEPDRPTAFVTCARSHAVSVIVAAEGLGLDVPRDLSVATIGDALHTHAADHEICTALVPEEQVGRRAVEMLEMKIAAPGEKLEPAVVSKHKWIDGTTTASAVDGK